MNISASNNSDESTGSHPTRSASGLKASDSEQHLADLPNKLLKTALSVEAPAHNLGPTTTFGMPKEPQPSSTACGIRGPFTIRSNGSLGQEILDADGTTIAWTTNLIVAQVIVELMSGITITKD